jgi:putative tricarboxylic transport membrane protein
VTDTDASSTTADSADSDDAADPANAVNAENVANWSALGWMVAGVALNAALITRLGFILSCALCFVLAVRGLRVAEGKAAMGFGAAAQAGRDLLTGAAIAAPVFWIFTKLLNIGLPGLTNSGWL